MATLTITDISVYTDSIALSIDYELTYNSSIRETFISNKVYTKSQPDGNGAYDRNYNSSGHYTDTAYAQLFYNYSYLISAAHQGEIDSGTFTSSYYWPEDEYYEEYDWGYYYYYDYYTGTTQEDIKDEEGNVTGIKYTYHYAWYDYYYYYDVWSTPTQMNIIKSTSFYTHPPDFTFNNCSSGKKWLVSAGISSLITNITEFQSYATQKKSWGTQTAASTCPDFDSPISAARLNSIYTYVGSTGGYSKGDRVSAAMFNGLASAINA